MRFLARSLFGLLVLGGSASAFASASDTPADKSAELPENHPVARSLAARLRALARTDPASAFATYGAELWQYGDGVLTSYGPLLIWAERDPVAPLIWLGERPPGEKRNSAIRWVDIFVPNDADFRPIAEALLRAGSVHRATLIALCSKWARFDPGQTLEWIESLPDPALRAECLEMASSRNHFSEPLPFPEQTLRLVLALPGGEPRARPLAQALEAWVLRDPSAAEIWAGKQSAPDVAPAYARAQADIAERIDRSPLPEKLGYLALRDPAAAIAEWEALPDDRVKADAIDLLVDAWGERDPASAVRWAFSNQKRFADLGIPGGGRYFPDRDPVYAWAKKAPLDALRWAEEAPIWRNEILRRLGGSTKVKRDRVATAELYLRIRDPELRIETLRRHVETWSEANPAAARAWVEANPALTADQRAKILPPAK